MIPEDRVTNEQQEVDPEKVLAAICHAVACGAQRGRNCSPHDSDAADWIPQVALRPWPSFVTQWAAGQYQSRRGKFLLDDGQAVREAASRFLPMHTAAAAAAWKHRNLSHGEQEGLPPMPKDRGAEQGDVDGPLERSLALGMVAAKVRGNTAARQAAGILPWIGVNDPIEVQRLQADYAARVQESAKFQLGGLEKLTGAHDPQHALQKNGSLADLWYMDDGDIMCHPILVPSFLQEFDVANAKVGAERNPRNRSHLQRKRPGCSASGVEDP